MICFHVDVDFAELPVQEKPVCNHTFSTEHIRAIDLEVSELLKKGVIRKAHHSNKEYISLIFVRPKKDNRWRMILSIALRPRKPEGSLGRTAQDGHHNSHTAPEL